MNGIPGAEISVDQESGGPPTDPPINIEIASENFDDLIKTATSLKNYLDSIQVPGVEDLKMDIDLNNPEITLTVDRERASIEGVSSGQIGQQIRTALFGKELSKIKEGKDEYKIQLRNNELQRKSLVDLLNMRISFRDIASGGAIKNIPISALVKVEPTSTLGSVKRKNQKRLITLRSNVLTTKGYNATGVNKEIAKYIADFNKKPDGVTIKQTGEGEQQAETGAFLTKALFIALMIILLVLVTQFNSVSKPIIILTEIVFSVIGVLLGFTITGMEVSVLMTGLGIVGLAGIVVKNGILVIEFTDELRARGLKTREAVVQAGNSYHSGIANCSSSDTCVYSDCRWFQYQFRNYLLGIKPPIFSWVVDNVAFWKPLSWTIIFGLAFAFFMTLFMVPGMYLIAERLKRPMRKMFGGRWISFLGIPPFILLFIPLMIVTYFVHRVKVARRRRKFTGKKISEAFVGSWF